MLDVNSKEKGGSSYLQNKIYKVEERLKWELKQWELLEDGAKAKNSEGTITKSSSTKDNVSEWV